MAIADYLPVFIQAVLALLLATVILAASYFFGQRIQRTRFNDTPYECGIDPVGKIHPRFSVKFYITAMLFILFDIEIVFLVPWTLIYREFIALHIPILLPVFFFLAVLVIGLIYELKKGALDWDH